MREGAKVDRHRAKGAQCGLGQGPLWLPLEGQAGQEVSVLLFPADASSHCGSDDAGL